MREHKYKAWDIKNKRMLSMEDMRGFCFPMFDCPSFIFLEYTGLKDNAKWDQLTEAEQMEWIDRGETKDTWNGKEIYEGDILQYQSGKYKGEKYILKYGVWNCGRCNSIYGWDFNGADNESQVILGNIYENVDILK